MSPIKTRLIHFETDGDIIKDFVASRLKKSAKLRRTIHACFYIQCVIAAACIIIGLTLSEELFGRVFASVAGAAVMAVAFFALGGGNAEKVISCIINSVYALVCFFNGGMALYICGGLMLLAAAAALVSAITGNLRSFLLDFSPLKITKQHYTLKEGAKPPRLYIEKPEELPPPPQKSELMSVAEQYMELFK